MGLHLRDIQKSFDGKPVLRGVSLEIADGETMVLLGPSGCGKTTLLRIIAGLETADSGSLTLDGRDLTVQPVHKRNFGFVFQDYALFPHKNVFQNIAFGLRMQRWSKERLATRVENMLQAVGLQGFGERLVHELSGGERQRVALARSLAPSPRLLLLDEPLGALDRALRERLMLELRAKLKQAGAVLGRPEGMTAVYVTHDQTEAFAIADQVTVMRDGRVEQQGDPVSLYRRPSTPFTARFLGMDNLFDGEIIADNPLTVRTVFGELVVAADAPKPGGKLVTVLIRPEAGALGSGGVNPVNGRLQSISFRGRYQQAIIETEKASLKLEFDTAVGLTAVGSPIAVALNPKSILLLERG